MKTITLGELLTEEQCNEVVNILNDSNDITEQVSRLREYLSMFRTELECKGALPEYLAYAIPYASNVTGSLKVPLPGRG